MNKTDYKSFSILPEPNRSTYKIRTMGNWANLNLSQNGPADILGLTSKGIFLETQSDGIIFLSGETFHGPLTVNLQCKCDFMKYFSMREEILIQDKQLFSKNCHILSTISTPVWFPVKVQFIFANFFQAVTRGISLVKKLIGDYADGLFYPFLNQLSIDPSKMTRNSLWTFFPELNQVEEPGNQLIRYLGLGSGLTPSGDDFLCGFLLAQYYLNQEAIFSQGFKELGERILAEAHIKTTALSTALINCALEGAADERLMDSLSFIAEGQGDIEKICNGLYHMGTLRE